MRGAVLGMAMAAVLAAPAVAKQPDKAKLGQARSAVAEAVAVEHLQARGRITSAYADTLRGEIKKALETLRKDPALADVAARAAAAIDGRDEAELIRLRNWLVGEERALGRAG